MSQRIAQTAAPALRLIVVIGVTVAEGSLTGSWRVGMPKRRQSRTAARHQVIANASTTAPSASSPSPAMNTVSA